jgi:hypothetical protein
MVLSWVISSPAKLTHLALDDHFHKTFYTLRPR